MTVQDGTLLCVHGKPPSVRCDQCALVAWALGLIASPNADDTPRED